MSFSQCTVHLTLLPLVAKPNLCLCTKLVKKGYKTNIPSFYFERIVEITHLRRTGNFSIFPRGFAPRKNRNMPVLLRCIIPTILSQSLVYLYTIYLYLFLTISIDLSISIYIYLYIYIYISILIYISIYQYPSISIYIYDLSLSISIHPSIYLSIYLPIYLYIYLYIYIYIYLSPKNTHTYSWSQKFTYTCHKSTWPSKLVPRC